MIVNIIILLSFVSNIVFSQTPSPPNPQQFMITAGKPKGSPQIEVTTNYVDRLAGLFRIDVTNEGLVTQQAFYYAAKKLGYDINYNKNGAECTRTKENYADMLAEWQTLSFSGRTKSISHPGLECYMWNKTVQSWTWSYLSSIKDNIPIEILDNSILISVYTNYTVGASIVPKRIFDLPIPEKSCK